MLLCVIGSPFIFVFIFMILILKMKSINILKKTCK